MQLPLAMFTIIINIVQCLNYTTIPSALHFVALDSVATNGSYAPFVLYFILFGVYHIGQLVKFCFCTSKIQNSVAVCFHSWYQKSILHLKTLNMWNILNQFWNAVLISYPITSRLRNSFTPSTFFDCLWSDGSSSSHCLARRVAFRSSSISAMLIPSLNLMRDCTCARSLRVWCNSFWRCARASSRASFAFVSATSWTLSPSRDFVPFGA